MEDRILNNFCIFSKKQRNLELILVCGSLTG